MSTAPRESWTAQTYLAFERTSQEKHEFLDGDIFLMTGASALIAGNIYASLHAQLRQRDTLLNPAVLVEVLSPSTENDDRGKKFQHYRRQASEV